MKRAVPVFACSLALGLVATAASAQVGTSAAVWTPTAPQESGQTVRAAIPSQAPRQPGAAQAPRATESAPMTADNAFDSTPNVRLDVTISYQVGRGSPVKRSATLLISSGDSGSLRSGNQVPVPTTTIGSPTAARGAEAVAAAATSPTPMTSYNYRSVGLNVDAYSVRVAGNRAKVGLSVEFSAIDEKANEPGRTAYPSFPTFSQRLTLVLENGKPFVVAQTSEVVDNVERSQSVEVKATIVR